MGRTSGLKSSGRWLTFTPMPVTRYWRALISFSSPISVRIPHSFFPSSTMSLVHLILGRTPQAAWMPSHTATATQAVKSTTSMGGSWGRRRAVRYSPQPRGDWKERPSRPRPPVCSSASTTRPSGAPAIAWRLASVLVESMVSRQSRRLPTRQPARWPDSSPPAPGRGADSRR